MLLVVLEHLELVYLKTSEKIFLKANFIPMAMNIFVMEKY